MKGIFIVLALLAVPATSYGNTAYGSLNNFDVVNDTGQRCYGFSIELDDLNSTDITYTYDYNHYGVPKITEDKTNPAHPIVFVRYESPKNPDGTYASYTNPQDPAHPLGPTDGHAFTNPSVNLGGEHFGVGFVRAPSAAKYNWLVDAPSSPGTLILGPAVTIATPAFVYVPPVPNVAPAVAQVVVAPPPPEVPENEGIAQFGPPVWMKVLKTVQPSGKHVALNELLPPDPEDPNQPNWAGNEPPETEVEWQIFQRRPPNDPNGEGEIQAEDNLPNGDETVTRRYEFYVYKGEVNPEDGEALCDDPVVCPEAVGNFIGAQMAGFNVVAPLGLIDHLQNGDAFIPYPDRTLVAGGNTPYLVDVTDGTLPDGLQIDSITGVISGTPTLAGTFQFTVGAMDGDSTQVSKVYSLVIGPSPGIATETLPNATENVDYLVTLTADGGVGPFQWTVDSLPQGLGLTLNGVLSGKPEPGTAGTTTLDFTLTDSLERAVSKSLLLVIEPAIVPPALLGDFSGDQCVDRTDLAILMSSLRAHSSEPVYDLNHDGKVDIADARFLVLHFSNPGGSPCPE